MEKINEPMKDVKTYKMKMGVFWWIERASHIRFISRELTSLGVAFFVVELLFLAFSIRKGQTSYESFISGLSHPVWIVLNLIALAGLLFHSITWFNLASKAMVIKIGDMKLPGYWITMFNYMGWLIISAFIVWQLF
jgi:fumarate reductase subunit C